MNTRLKFLPVLFLAVFCLEAAACGDSLYRVGKGGSYRSYTAPLPGSVLVYGPAEGARQLADALAQSGHGVRVVDSEVMLSTELGSGRYDVVIAPYDRHETVEAINASNTTFLPVAYNADEARVAHESYSSVMLAERDEIKHYLRAIHKSLKNMQL